MLLLIDNYDSFAHNLSRYFQRLGQTTNVVRNDAITFDEVASLNPTAIVLSPGPCSPKEAGCCLEIVQRFWNQKPILGVCLGHQAICEALGANIIRAEQPMHGRTSEIQHDGRGIFSGQPNPLTVSRYHSLVVERSSLPASLEVTAETTDAVVMAVRHREQPIVGVQFHPESILTEQGYPLLAGFLKLAGCQLAGPLPSILDERPTVEVVEAPLPHTPITF